MNPALKIVAGVMATVLGFLFFSYGVVTPCGILKKEMRSAVVHKALEKQETETDEWGKAGIGLGLALGRPMIDSMVDGLTPMQCTRAIINIAMREPPVEKSPWPFSGSSSSRTNTTPLTEAGQDAEYEAVRKQDTIQAYQDFLYRKKAHDKHYAEALARLDELLHPGGQTQKAP